MHSYRIEHLDVTSGTIPTDAPEGDGTLQWQATTIVIVHAWAGDTWGHGLDVRAAGGSCNAG